MALILVFHNDGTGTDGSANYDVEVRVNDRVIDSAKLKGHTRGDGWRALVRHWLDATEPDRHHGFGCARDGERLDEPCADCERAQLNFPAPKVKVTRGQLYYDGRAAMQFTTEHNILNRGLVIERLCEHGVGHPIGTTRKAAEDEQWVWVHGCDGCCAQWS